MTAGTIVHFEDYSEDCEDFRVPMGYEGIFSNKETHVFELYPNPVGNILNLSNLKDVNKVDVFDINGRLVITKDVNTLQISINTSQLTDGVYIISYHTSNGVLTSKFVKD